MVTTPLCTNILSYLRVKQGTGNEEVGRCIRIESILKKGNEISILHKNGWHRYIFSGLISKPSHLSKISPQRLSSVIYPNPAQTYSNITSTLLAKLHHGNSVLIISIGKTGIEQKGGLIERLTIGIGGVVNSEGATIKAWSIGVTSIRDLLSTEKITISDASVDQLKEIKADMKGARDIMSKMKKMKTLRTLEENPLCCLFTSGSKRHFSKLLILSIPDPKYKPTANGLFALSQELKGDTLGNWRSTLITRIIAKSLFDNSPSTLSRVTTPSTITVATITSISSSIIDRERTRDMIKLTKMLNPTISVPGLIKKTSNCNRSSSDLDKGMMKTTNIKNTYEKDRGITQYTIGVSSFNPIINPTPLVPYAGTQYDNMRKTFTRSSLLNNASVMEDSLIPKSYRIQQIFERMQLLISKLKDPID